MLDVVKTQRRDDDMEQLQVGTFSSVEDTFKVLDKNAKEVSGLLSLLEQESY